MDKLRLILLPFSLIYALVILIRNKFYDWGIFKSTAFSKPIICVGNLAVGGSGKTPVVEYLVKLLRGRRVAILSRGYGRKTRGFILADDDATADTIGDEPLQYYRKFKHVTVAVCEDRVLGAKRLMYNHDVILLDDAYQHRAIKAGFNLLLFDYSKLGKWQFLLPAGNLREPFIGYKRAQQILITKCPAVVDKEALVDKFGDFKTHVAFSKISYGQLQGVFSSVQLPLSKAQHVFLLSGIANPSPLVAYLDQSVKIEKHFEHPDHYPFKKSDIEKLVKAFETSLSENKIIVTTEKDAQRLLNADLKDLLLNLPIYYLPIEIQLDREDKQTFDRKILTYVAEAQ